MWRGRHNFELNPDRVLTELYRLLTLFAADQVLMTNRNELTALRDRFVEDELVHLLVSTAIANRIQEEHMRGPRNDETELSFRPLEQCCGELRRNLDRESSVPLTLREGCNKIVHALEIYADTDGENGPISHVFLRGEQYEQLWEARLEIREYVWASIQNFGGV